MLGGGNPVANDLVEFHVRHTRVRFDHDFHERRFTPGKCSLHVALQQGRERFLGHPLWMLRSQYLDAVKREQKLKIQRLLGP